MKISFAAILLVTVITSSAIAESPVTVTDVVIYGPKLEKAQLTTKASVMTKSGELLTSVAQAPVKGEYICLIDETKDYANLPYNLNLLKQIEKDLCFKEVEMYLTKFCYPSNWYPYVSRIAGSETPVEIKAYPVELEIKLSNGGRTYVDCRE